MDDTDIIIILFNHQSIYRIWSAVSKYKGSVVIVLLFSYEIISKLPNFESNGSSRFSISSKVYIIVFLVAIKNIKKRPFGSRYLRVVNLI